MKKELWETEFLERRLIMAGLVQGVLIKENNKDWVKHLRGECSCEEILHSSQDNW